ncbi:hypothetical protein B0T19DRAFT_434436 [Cercophora scortea]|uniref:Uncharacterized protein n=1 Tax=Cercophora scortea TaxID=314031 RepID=A0AAE0M2X3_9PEZI|nr:hypothetical protein B0T19DRAFT_434436 [Cercophora scortea]
MEGFPGAFSALAGPNNSKSGDSTFDRSPIPAASLQPPHIPWARPWQRVQVPAANDTRQRKIWKRVGGIATPTALDPYVCANAELESQGHGTRKRFRQERHIPVYGDARWDARANALRDGKWDLVEARAAVSVAKNTAAATIKALGLTTLPDDSPKWVPRKRHNSRWPIEPAAKPTRMMADLQPLIEFDIPAVDEQPDSTQQVDDKQKRRRSMRRLSRRISLGPEEESPHKLSSITLSPVKSSVPQLSPLKRPPVALSPRKVVESPLQNFMINATPTKVVLEEPRTRTPAGSPYKSSPPPPAQEGTSVDGISAETLTSVYTHDSSPLLFDQPIPATPAEPQHETRRRVSLHSARRSERRSSGGAAARLADFESVRAPPNRRHSFALTEQLQTDVKDRRSTLDAFFVASDEVCDLFAASCTDNDSTTDSLGAKHNSDSVSLQAPCPAFEVDVGTNLDIFGSASEPAPASTPARPRPSPDQDTTIEDVTSSASEYHRADVAMAVSSPVMEEGTVFESVSVNSPANSCSGFTDSGIDESTTSDQAAMNPGPDAYDAEPHNFGLTLPSQSEEEFEFGFDPRDPEGLSTIYEESFTDAQADAQILAADPGPQAERRAIDAGVLSSQPLTSIRTGVGFGRSTSPVEENARHEQELDQAPTAPHKQTPSSGTESRTSSSNPGHVSGPAAASDVVDPETLQRCEETRAEGDSIDQPPQSPHAMPVDDASGLFSGSQTLHGDNIGLANHEAGLVDGMRPTAEEAASRRGATSVSTNHVDNVLSEPDSPKQFPEEPAIGLAAMQKTGGMENTGTLSNPSRHSNATPDDSEHLCGIISLDVGTIGQAHPASLTVSSPKMDPIVCKDQDIAIDVRSEGDKLSVVVPDVVVGGNPSSQEAALAPKSPGTPTQARSTGTLADLPATTGRASGVGSPDSNSSGSSFTPINVRQISPPAITSTAVEAESDDADIELREDDQVTGYDVMNIDEIEEEEEEEVVDEDYTLTVEAPHPENDTLTLQGLHEDSETEMLRKFVTRVTADKNAKAAAAAAAASVTKKTLRSKRRSGSTGSTTTSTGSPIAKSETPVKRTPLGEKSLNSPSPVKKRKLEEVDEDPSKGKEDKHSSSSDDNASNTPALKRRRKLRTDPSRNPTVNNLSAAPAEVAESSSVEDGGPRRSTRARSTRIALRPAGYSANSIARSMFEVRLPGGIAGMMDDVTLSESHHTASRHRNEEKDVAAVTKVNTRKNKGNAVSPRTILAQQAEDPNWRMKELKSVFDAHKSRAGGKKKAKTEEEGVMAETSTRGEDGEATMEKVDKAKKAKGVRWAEELVRFQGDDGMPPAGNAFRAMSSSLLADVLRGDAADEIDELAGDSAPAHVEEPATAQSMPVAKKTVARRTRSSRLQAPTPIKKLSARSSSAAAEKKSAPSPAPPAPAAPAAAATATKTKAKATATPAAARATALPKASASTSGSGSTSASKSTSAASGSRAGMATRRTRIASLGMGVNGTPAPKRRGRPLANASAV